MQCVNVIRDRCVIVEAGSTTGICARRYILIEYIPCHGTTFKNIKFYMCSRKIRLMNMMVKVVSVCMRRLAFSFHLMLARIIDPARKTARCRKPAIEITQTGKESSLPSSINPWPGPPWTLSPSSHNQESTHHLPSTQIPSHFTHSCSSWTNHTKRLLYVVHIPQLLSILPIIASRIPNNHGFSSPKTHYSRHSRRREYRKMTSIYS